MESIRLQRYLSQAGVSARRKGEDLIVGGHVSVNGKIVRTLGTKVDPGRDEVRVDGRLVEPEEKVYFVLNKPKGYVTTVEDPQGRKTVLELLPPDHEGKVAPVGRLDYYTEGVLLVTNDGELQAALLSPRSHVEKTYHAKLRGEVPMKAVERLRRGVRLDDGRRTRPAKVDVLKRTGRHTWLVISITEGKSRQIHKMAEAIGFQVIKLQRVAFAGITFWGLKIGESRRLTGAEVRSLRQLAGLTDVEAKTARRSRLPRPGASRDRSARRKPPH